MSTKKDFSRRGFFKIAAAISAAPVFFATGCQKEVNQDTDLPSSDPSVVRNDKVNQSYEILGYYNDEFGSLMANNPTTGPICTISPEGKKKYYEAEALTAGFLSAKNGSQSGLELEIIGKIIIKCHQISESDFLTASQNVTKPLTFKGDMGDFIDTIHKIIPENILNLSGAISSKEVLVFNKDISTEYKEPGL